MLDPEYRVPDHQYRNLLKAILTNGTFVQTQQGVRAYTLMAPRPLRYEFSNGFPMITERNLNTKTSERLPVTIWQQAIGEIIGFINGARTQDELESYGCYWWKDWVTPEKCAKRELEPGDLGPGSYGAAFHDFPTIYGTFNQVEKVIQQIREQPQLRTHFISPWIPQYTVRLKGTAGCTSAF